MTTIAVTGATGRLGGMVARRLADAGIEQRLVVRDPSRAPSLDGAETAQAEYGDASATRQALQGIDTVLMVSASESPDRVDRHRAFIDAAARTGVRHIVYTSFFGAGPRCTFLLGRDHWHTEEHLRASGLGHTILRDNLYADFMPQLATDGVIRGPAGEGRVAVVATRDIADVAVAVLRKPDAHAGCTYDLTGPAALSLTEIAAVLTQTTGRPVRYEDETIEQAYASRTSHGAPGWQVDAWVSTYTAIAAGELAGIGDDITRITGHPATSLHTVLSG